MKTALIVEDSSLMRELICSTIATLPGLQSLEAPDGIEALKMIPEMEIDIILTDINMPGINGLELLSFIKKHPRFKKIPVILITSRKTDADLQKALALGADHYMIKPFEPSLLQDVVRQTLQL